MYSVRAVLAFTSSLLLGLISALGVDNTEEPSLVGEPDYAAFKLVGADAGKVDFAVQPLNELGAHALLHLTTKSACAAPYGAQIVQSNRVMIHKGDVLLAHFYLRTRHSSLESQEGLTEFVVENATTFDKNVQFHAAALGDWRDFYVPFTAANDFAPGQASIIFRAGYQPQEIEIAGFVLKDLGGATDLARSPTGVIKLHYAGEASDAPWRVAAEQRIEKIRKANFTIEVVDGEGKPVEGAKLTVQQTRHAYWFGSAVRVDHLVEPKAPNDEAKYRAAVAENFNAVTFENDLKWPFWQRDFPATLAADEWLSGQHIALRGHAFVWPSKEKGLPPDLYPLVGKPEELRQAILDHIRDVTAQVQPPAAAWDVVNEAFRNHEFMDVLGPDAMPSWYAAAHAGTPQSRLFINDWGIITSGGIDAQHQAEYEKTIASLVAAKAPLDGIGLQGHFGTEPTPPEKMVEVLDRFAKFGKEIQLTEYSTQFSDPNDAAKYLHDCLTVFFSELSTSGFILWGFRDGIGMQNKSFLYDKNWKLTPSGEVWKDLVYGKWWTKTDAVSAADGQATVSGFLGEYQITARNHGVESHATAELKPGGTTIKIVLTTPQPTQAASAN